MKRIHSVGHPVFRLFLIMLLAASGELLPDRTLEAGTLPSQIPELLRNRIEEAGTPPQIVIRGELVHASVMLPLFYERRLYQAAWIDDEGPSSQANNLVKVIGMASREGLRPENYHLGKIETLLNEVRQNRGKQNRSSLEDQVDLELLLTDSFLIYAAHLLSGLVNPETIDPEWLADRKEADLSGLLQRALETNRVEDVLLDLLPKQSGYIRLREALAYYRDIDARGGWKEIPGGPSLRKGNRNERVAMLRTRLFITGDVTTEYSGDGDLFDDNLQRAVVRFQKRHALEADGIAGPGTLAALNIPVGERIRRIEANMERWRWLPQDLGRRYILVNVAGFELYVVEKDVKVMTMRAIVGRSYRRTPVFSDRMTYVVFNPYWHVPPGIAVKDILPALRKDPEYLARQNFKVFQGWGGASREINPDAVDWNRVTGKNINYRFRQEPGPLNALGRVKFMFPNKFDVYLHDTPYRELFEKPERGFSSGCIRLEKPVDLAEYVLKSDKNWSREQILAAMDTGTEQTVRLPDPIPIHILYWTVWVDDDGILNIRKDLYGRDRKLLEALMEKPPGAEKP